MDGDGIRVRKSRYKDQQSVTLESDALVAEFLPGFGSKMCGLVYRPLDRQLLVQRPGAAYRVAPYDGDYVGQGECSGMDDMFPTIDRCFYERFPWRGVEIPDHGEVWSLRWDCAVEGTALRFSTRGVRFPYRLEKRVSFRDARTLRFAYRLTNDSDHEFEYFWAIHPMILVEEGVEVVLPPGVRKVVTAFSSTGELGRWGDEFDWPVATLPDGRRLDLRPVRAPSAGQMNKYFVGERLAEGWCALRYRRSGFTLRFSFPAGKIPYCAVLPNEAGWNGHHSVFLEPATARADRLDVARLRGEQAVVGPRASTGWEFELSVAEEPPSR